MTYIANVHGEKWSWGDIYVIEAKSREEAESKVREEYAGYTGKLTISLTKINLSSPVQVHYM